MTSVIKTGVTGLDSTLRVVIGVLVARCASFLRVVVMKSGAIGRQDSISMAEELIETLDLLGNEWWIHYTGRTPVPDPEPELGRESIVVELSRAQRQRIN